MRNSASHNAARALGWRSVSIREKKNFVGLVSKLRVGQYSGVLASEARGPSYAGLPLETRFYPIG